MKSITNKSSKQQLESVREKKKKCTIQPEHNWIIGRIALRLDKPIKELTLVGGIDGAVTSVLFEVDLVLKAWKHLNEVVVRLSALYCRNQQYNGGDKN
jgi:hypothetical protein